MFPTLLKPSTLLPDGLQTQQINNLTLFKFTPQLGERLQTLLDKQKAETLTAEESLKLAAIGEFDDIFSYINAVMFAQANANSYTPSCATTLSPTGSK
jgi:hypothetical protein